MTTMAESTTGMAEQPIERRSQSHGQPTQTNGDVTTTPSKTDDPPNTSTISTQPLPTPATLAPSITMDPTGFGASVFRNQVAGHSPLLWHKGTICKPLHPTEYYFYSHLIQGELSALGPFTPKFYGILDMSYIPIEFQKQQLEKDQRKAEKRLVLKERERREQEAKAATNTSTTPLKTTATTTTTSPSSSTSDSWVITSSDTLVSSVSEVTPHTVHFSATTSASTTQTVPSLLATSHSIPDSLSINTLAQPNHSQQYISQSASPPSSTAASSTHQMNTWVYACQNRQKKTSSMVNIRPQTTQAADDSPNEFSKSHTLPASFQLNTILEQSQLQNDIWRENRQPSPSEQLAEQLHPTSPPLLTSAIPDTLAASTDSTASSTSTTLPSQLPQYIVLEDLTFAYDRPCILDLKLGTRQHGIHDSAKKIASKIEKCSKTTSGKLGIRLCGMQVYHPARKQGTNKGTETTNNQTTNDSTNSAGDPSADDGKYIYYDKYYGRSLTEDSFLKTLKLFFWNGEKLLLHIILLFLERLDKLRKTLELRQMNQYRFYSSSLLMVYEGSATNQTCTDPPTLIEPPKVRPDYYPALSSLNSSSRLHDILDRSLSISTSSSASSTTAGSTNAMSRSHSIDFHSVNSQATEQGQTDHPTDPLESPSASPPPGHVPTHLDAEDVLELHQILSREVARIADIRRAYQPIVVQKVAEEKVEEAKRCRLLEAAEREAQAPIAPTHTTMVNAVVHTPPPSDSDRLHSATSLPDSAARTPGSSAGGSSVDSSITPIPSSIFSPNDHIAYVHVTDATDSRRSGQTILTVNDSHDGRAPEPSPQPSSPLPIPGMEERSLHLTPTNSAEPPVVTMQPFQYGHNSTGPHLSVPSAATHPSPSPAPSNTAPKFYRTTRKTTHAMARERARLKGNIDIRLIDYAQVVKWEDGEERPIVADPSAPASHSTPSTTDPVIRDGMGDPGLLIGVNNLIYFISNIVQQEIHQMLLQEEQRTNTHSGDSITHHHAATVPIPPHPCASTSTNPSNSRVGHSTNPIHPSQSDSSLSSSIPCPIPSSSHTAAFASSHVPRQKTQLRTPTQVAGP